MRPGQCEPSLGILGGSREDRFQVRQRLLGLPELYQNPGQPRGGASGGAGLRREPAKHPQRLAPSTHAVKQFGPQQKGGRIVRVRAQKGVGQRGCFAGTFGPGQDHGPAVHRRRVLGVASEPGQGEFVGPELGQQSAGLDVCQ